MEAKSLDSYLGLTRFCTDTKYRNELIELLHSIHHYDSMVYDRLLQASRRTDNKEIKKTPKGNQGL